MVFIMLHGNQFICPICLVRSSCERIWSETCFKMWPEVWMVCLVCNLAVQWPAQRIIITTWRQKISERHCSVSVEGMRSLAPTALLPWTLPWRPGNVFCCFRWFHHFLPHVTFLFCVLKPWVLPGIEFGRRRWGHGVCWDQDNIIYWCSNRNKIHSECMTDPHITWIVRFHAAQWGSVVRIVIIFWNVVLAQAGFPRNRRWTTTVQTMKGDLRRKNGCLPILSQLLDWIYNFFNMKYLLIQRYIYIHIYWW